ncbi:MAG: hypothetical protein L6Q29_04315 [Candidatus Pacebacteria bacterium]|nr:hypothetical protein [Candidatus Paceibacterota bacterium]
MKKNKVKIIWNDAVIYTPDSKPEELSKMETVGFLEKESEEFLIISKPETHKISTGKKHPEKQPYFYFIPKGMVEKIEHLN